MALCISDTMISPSTSLRILKPTVFTRLKFGAWSRKTVRLNRFGNSGDMTKSNALYRKLQRERYGLAIIFCLMTLPVLIAYWGLAFILGILWTLWFSASFITLILNVIMRTR